MPLKSILKYIGLFCCCYVGLYFLLSLKPVNEAHRNFYLKLANPFLDLALPKAYTTVQKGVRSDTGHDNMISVLFAKQATVDSVIEAQKRAIAGTGMVSVRTNEFTLLFTELAVIPLCFLLSLILITPMAWRQKARAALWSLVLFYLFLLVKTYILSLDYISLQKIGVYELGPASSRFFQVLHNNLKIGASMAVGTMIWVLVSFRKSNWQQLVESLTLQKK